MMLKEIFHDSSENSEITRICMVNHAIVTGWQKLFSHTNVSNFRRPLQSLEKRLKILRSPNFNMLLQLVLTKLNCFHVYRKLIT